MVPKSRNRPVVEQDSLNLVLSKAKDPGNDNGRPTAAKNFLLKLLLHHQFAKEHPFSFAEPAPLPEFKNRNL